jgi:hypothetical protein
MMSNQGSVKTPDHDHTAADTWQQAKDKLQNLGRFPANVLLAHHPDCEEVECADDCAVKILDEQSGISKGSGKPTITQAGIGGGVLGKHDGRKKMPTAKEGLMTMRNVGDSGGASRFFKCVDACPVKILDEQAPAVGNAFQKTRTKDTSGGSGDSWTNGGKKAGEDI